MLSICTPAPIALCLTCKHQISFLFSLPKDHSLLHASASNRTSSPPCLLSGAQTGCGLRGRRRIVAVIARLFKVAALDASSCVLLVLLCDVLIVLALIGCMLRVAWRVADGHASADLRMPVSMKALQNSVTLGHKDVDHLPESQVHRSSSPQDHHRRPSCLPRTMSRSCCHRI